jgi:hypothetical protein
MHLILALFSGLMGALVLSAGPRIVLDDTIEIPRSEWRYVDVIAKEARAVVNCEYQVMTEKAEVRAVWIARKDLEFFRAGRRDDILATTQFGSDGRLRHFAPEAGDYAMVIENEPAGHATAKVKVRVWTESAVSPRYASPERRLAVILISGILFFAIVSFSAYKLRSANE